MSGVRRGAGLPPAAGQKFPASHWSRAVGAIGRSAAAFFTGVGLMLALVAGTPFVSWYARVLAGPWNDPRGDILIVLGGAAVSEDLFALDSYWRSVYALRAYREHPFRRVVVCGAGVSGAMRNFLIFSGVPNAVVETENRSGSTRENALYVAKMLAKEPGPKVLLTSGYHTFRACRAFRKAGLNVEPRPIPYALKRAGSALDRWSVFQEEAAETVKILVYWMRGWI